MAKCNPYDNLIIRWRTIIAASLDVHRCPQMSSFSLIKAINAMFEYSSGVRVSHALNTEAVLRCGITRSG